MPGQVKHAALTYERLVNRAFFPVSVKKEGPSEPLVAKFTSQGIGCFKRTKGRVFHSSPIIVRRSRQDIEERAEDSLLLVAPASGEVCIHQFGRSAQVSEQRMVLVDPRKPYDFERRRAGTVVSHHIPGAILREAMGRGSDDYCAVGFDAYHGIGDSIRALLVSGWRQMGHLRDGERYWLLHSIVRLIASACNDADSKGGRQALLSTPPFVRAIEFIERNLEDSSLKASKIAECIGISESHLHATMKKHGATVGSTIILMRLDKCAQDLVSPSFREARITDIAFGRGFSDAAHFSRTFRARFGCSPSQFRDDGLRVSKPQI